FVPAPPPPIQRPALDPRCLVSDFEVSDRLLLELQLLGCPFDPVCTPLCCHLPLLSRSVIIALWLSGLDGRRPNRELRRPTRDLRRPNRKPALHSLGPVTADASRLQTLDLPGRRFHSARRHISSSRGRVPRLTEGCFHALFALAGGEQRSVASTALDLRCLVSVSDFEGSD